MTSDHDCITMAKPLLQTMFNLSADIKSKTANSVTMNFSVPSYVDFEELILNFLKYSNHT